MAVATVVIFLAVAVAVQVKLVVSALLETAVMVRLVLSQVRL